MSLNHWSEIQDPEAEFENVEMFLEISLASNPSKISRLFIVAIYLSLLVQSGRSFVIFYLNLKFALGV